MSDEMLERPWPSSPTRPAASPIRVPVLIVGAGPAGLVTGIGLARHGVRSMIVERHRPTSIFPRQPASARDRWRSSAWGLEDAVRRGGWRVIPRMAGVARFDDQDPVGKTAQVPRRDAEPRGQPDPRGRQPAGPPRAGAARPVPLVGRPRLLLDGARRFRAGRRWRRATIRDRETARRPSFSPTTSSAPTSTGAWSARRWHPDGRAGRSRPVLQHPLPPTSPRSSASVGHGLYALAGDGPPTVLVPSGTDDRFVLAMPLPQAWTRPRFRACSAGSVRGHGPRGYGPTGPRHRGCSGDRRLRVLRPGRDSGASDGPSSSATRRTG